MKKIALLSGVLFYVFFQHIKAQSQGVNFGDLSSPVPSVSALANYTNSPPSNATGIPDISFPLAALSTYNTNIKLNAAISYDPNSAAQGSPTTQVGSGWSLFTPGVISRHITLLPDEVLPDSNHGNSDEVYFNDVYYYNIPGVFGKFRFKRNVQNNTFELINLSANKLKIEYTRENNSTKLTVKDFTITDNNGVRYLFKDYSQSNYNNSETLLTPEGLVYRSAFFVSQIIDANGLELASFSYQKNTKYRDSFPNVIDYQTCKIKTITAIGFGKLDFEYTYDSFLANSINDPYQLQNVVLKDYYNHIISKYEFEYNFVNYAYDTKRELTKFKKINKNNQLQEAIEFVYKTITPPPTHPYPAPSGLCPRNVGAISWSQNRVLNKVINPYGGIVEYNFEFADIYEDKTVPNYVNAIKNETQVSDETHYLIGLGSVDFDTNQSREYTFVVPGNYSRRVFISLGIGELYPLDPFGSVFDEAYLDFTIDGIAGEACGMDYYGTRQFFLQPGAHTLRINGTGGLGSVGISGLEYVPFPYPNKSRSLNVVRISDIKYYTDKTDTTPAKTIAYNYDDFSDTNSSSGYWSFSDQDLNSSYILYKNVKVSDSDDSNGYTKYYYKTADDFPTIGNYHPYYALTCGGLLDKKEVYNNLNKLLVSEKTEYTFEEISGAQEYYLWGAEGTVSKPAWLKKTINTVTNNLENNQSVQESVETEFNAVNFKIASTKKTDDGVSTETSITYPESSGAYSMLFSKNIIGIPVIQETKESGNTARRSETKFDNASSTLPTSIQTTNINDGSTKTAMTFDLYDEKGNLLQMTSSAGIPTAIVYGYDKTLPIAKIQGATYAQVLPYIQAIVDASNADAADPANEPALLTALDNFRKNTVLQNFVISTNTYNPLIGMTTNTAANGMREIYIYSADNRLEKITDSNGKVLKEYKYNYKN